MGSGRGDGKRRRRNGKKKRRRHGVRIVVPRTHRAAGTTGKRRQTQRGGGRRKPAIPLSTARRQGSGPKSVGGPVSWQFRQRRKRKVSGGHRRRAGTSPPILIIAFLFFCFFFIIILLFFLFLGGYSLIVFRLCLPTRLLPVGTDGVVVSTSFSTPRRVRRVRPAGVGRWYFSGRMEASVGTTFFFFVRVPFPRAPPGWNGTPLVRGGLALPIRRWDVWEMRKCRQKRRLESGRRGTTTTTRRRKRRRDTVCSRA